MSMASRTDTLSPALDVADSHDLIRVHGARVNNLKDVSIEIPKRRLTVFTGVSGSGKSSLVFETIAAESQRMINETYSAFVQGFMPTLSRPEVDVLDGLTTAIIVDQERMGSNPRSTVIDQGAIRGSRRSNPATYTGLLDPIRKAFAKANGVKPALFSANSEGACPTCNGVGVIYTDLGVMATVESTREECEGKRFQASVLDYTLGGRNIAEVLAMPVTEAEPARDTPIAATPPRPARH